MCPMVRNDPVPYLREGCAVCSARPTMPYEGNYYCFDHWIEFFEHINEATRENIDKLTEQGISDE